MAKRQTYPLEPLFGRMLSPFEQRLREEAKLGILLASRIAASIALLWLFQVSRKKGEDVPA